MMHMKHIPKTHQYTYTTSTMHFLKQAQKRLNVGTACFQNTFLPSFLPYFHPFPFSLQYDTTLDLCHVFHFSTVKHHLLHLLLECWQRLHGTPIDCSSGLRCRGFGYLRLHVEPGSECSQMCIVSRWHCSRPNTKCMSESIVLT